LAGRPATATIPWLTTDFPLPIPQLEENEECPDDNFK
jgi:hypothetical protein